MATTGINMIKIGVASMLMPMHPKKLDNLLSGQSHQTQYVGDEIFRRQSFNLRSLHYEILEPSAVFVDK